jgi:hypothetical protein
VRAPALSAGRPGAVLQRRLPPAVQGVLLGLGVSLLTFYLVAKAPISVGPRSVAIAVLVLTCVWLFLTERTELGLIVVMLYVALLDGFIRLKTGDGSLTIVRDALLYSLIAGIVLRKLARGERFDAPLYTAWIVAFALIVVVQVLNPGNASIIRAAGGIRPQLEFAPLFFLGYAVMRTERRLRVFLILLLVVAAINGVVGFIQFRLTPAQLAGWGPGYYDRILGVTFENAGRIFYTSGGVHTRPFGLGSDVGFGGLMGMLAVPAMIALLGLPGRRKPKLAATALGVGVIIAVVTSQSRTAVIGTVVAAIAFLFLGALSRRTVGTLVAMIVALALTLGVISQVASGGSAFRYSDITPAKLLGTTEKYRSAEFSAIPTYLVKYPFGAGLGKTGPAAGFTRSTKGPGLNGETEFTFLNVETGVAGLLLILVLTLKFLQVSVRVVRRIDGDELRTLLAAIAAPLFAIAIAWITTTPTAVAPTSPYFWFAGGTLVYWLRASRRRPSDQVRPPVAAPKLPSGAGAR